VIDRSKLEVDSDVESIVMATAQGKVFSQIKGTYIQIKVKGFDETIKFQTGDHLISKLKKVTKEKISSIFVSKVKGSQMTKSEEYAQSIYNSIQEEAAKDIKTIKDFNNQKKTQKTDFDAAYIEQNNFIGKEEQI